MSLIQASIRYVENKRIETHYAFAGHDMSICGHDIAGDLEWEPIEGGERRKMNCPECKEIYTSCVEHWQGKQHAKRHEEKP